MVGLSISDVIFGHKRTLAAKIAIKYDCKKMRKTFERRGQAGLEM